MRNINSVTWNTSTIGDVFIDDNGVKYTLFSKNKEPFGEYFKYVYTFIDEDNKEFVKSSYDIEIGIVNIVHDMTNT